MRFFKRSLMPKLILAFWVVSIAGIIIVALMAGRVSQQEFNRYINESHYQGLVDDLSGYFTRNGNFKGADYLLKAAQSLPGTQTKEYLVVDLNGDILLALAQHIPPVLSSPVFTRFGFPINSNGNVVAYLIPLRSPRGQNDQSNEILQNINLNIIFGVIFATLIALFFGWILARNIIRPLTNLTAVTQAIAQGDLENQVTIKSRDEIGTLADSFNQMITSLKRSRDLRRQMTADIAHELRNPLSIILGHAEALSEGVLPATPETLFIIYDEAKHLSRLVDDLRTLSLSESRELHLQLSLAAPQEIVERCASAFAIRANELGLTIRTQYPPDFPKVNVDVERILQVLANLVDNSLKHTPKGGTILISASSTKENSVISVKDTGSGIQPDDLPFIFDRFYRGKLVAGRIQDGSGLGLAISRALVELHGVQISVVSQPGEGTTITIRLPASGGQSETSSIDPNNPIIFPG